MKVKEIYPEHIVITHDMVVIEDGKEECYTRHSPDDWSFFISYNIHGEDIFVGEEKAKQLEALFQEYKELV